MGSMGGLRIIEDTIHPSIFYDLVGGMGSMGGLRIIENTIVSMHFLMICSVGWGAWAGSEPLKIQ